MNTTSAPRYSVKVNFGTVTQFARKDRAVKFGEDSGQYFQVFSPAGSLVHEGGVVDTPSAQEHLMAGLLQELVAAAANVKMAKAGYARLVGSDGKTLAWVNENHIDFPGSTPRVNLDGALGMLRSVA